MLFIYGRLLLLCWVCGGTSSREKGLAPLVEYFSAVVIEFVSREVALLAARLYQIVRGLFETRTCKIAHSAVLGAASREARASDDAYPTAQ